MIAVGTADALTGPSRLLQVDLLHLIGAIEQSDVNSIEVGGSRSSAPPVGCWRRYRPTDLGSAFQRSLHLLLMLTALENVIALLILGFCTHFD